MVESNIKNDVELSMVRYVSKQLNRGHKFPYWVLRNFLTYSIRWEEYEISEQINKELKKQKEIWLLKIKRRYEKNKNVYNIEL